MLVISRKVNEKIYIGPDIIISVAKIGTNSARIGIEAPDTIRVMREELLTCKPQAQDGGTNPSPTTTTDTQP